jgi:hypothetical protein
VLNARRLSWPRPCALDLQRSLIRGNKQRFFIVSYHLAISCHRLLLSLCATPVEANRLSETLPHLFLEESHQPLTVSPLLVLGSDQTAKLKTLIQPGTGIEAVHLDEIGMGSQKEKILIKDIESRSSSASNKTLLLLSSPQWLVASKSWTECLSCMISNSLLRMVYVDKVHLCVMHGLHFRPQFFQLLKDILFDKMNTCPIPVVFMTATATEEMLQNAKRLSGLSILRSNTNWPCHDGIQR